METVDIGVQCSGDDLPASCSNPSTINGVSSSNKQQFNSTLLLKWFNESTEENKLAAFERLMKHLPKNWCNDGSLSLLLFGGIPPTNSAKHEIQRDPLTSLPATIAFRILDHLDPESLCRCSRVSRAYYQLATDSSLWKSLCYNSRQWRLSTPIAEQRQLDRMSRPDGSIKWKDAFAERYRLWKNWTRGRCVVRTFEGHTQGISCVQFDDDRIVSGSSDTTIKLWNIRTNQNVMMTLTGHSATVRCLQFSGNRLASGSNDCSIKVWDVSGGQTWNAIACRVTMVGHGNSVRCLQMDHEKIVSGSYDRTLKNWDLNTGICRSTLRGHDEAVICLQFDDRKIISGSADTSIKLWDITSGECIMTLHNAHSDAVTCLQFDETRIVSGSLDRCIKFWDIRTGRWITTLDWTQHEGHTGVIRCLQADRWRIVSAADDRTLKVWSLQTGQRLVTLKSHTDGVTCLQFNDQRIVSGSYDKSVKLWDFSIC